jgi:hypothetical protein
MTHYRQGHVLILVVESLPEGATPIVADGPIVLAHGTSTGHSHAIARGGVALFAHGERRYLSVVEPGKQIVHEEHSAIDLPVGSYEVRDVAGNGITQVEYTPTELRRVED